MHVDSEAVSLRVVAPIGAIQGGNLIESYPDAEGRPVVIELVTRVELPDVGLKFIDHVRQTAKQLDVEIRSRTGSV